MSTTMFKRLRYALLLLPILSVGALAGCTAQLIGPVTIPSLGVEGGF